jgi:hypothetical protein
MTEFPAEEHTQDVYTAHYASRGYVVMALVPGGHRRHVVWVGRGQPSGKAAHALATFLNIVTVGMIAEQVESILDDFPNMSE